jgi:eukaryotic-like serine/threonine-protein kinase
MKYRFEQRLGGGGMAEVFVGSTVGAEGFSRKVAIKRVLPGYSDNPSFAQMFVAEARISSRLVHPNIVSVLDFDRDPENRLFLVMELVEGRDLDALVSSGPLPFPVIIYVLVETLRGLGYAHDLPVASDLDAGDTISGMRGVVHRDVSPHNVLLSWEGAVKVSDFGIAKARAASEATASVFIKGKPAYMSPEQANGQPLDGRSDLFAVGVMLWEMLCGRRLFSGEDTRSTLAAVLFGQIPRPRSLRPDVPKDLERVVMKLLERDLPARYATAELAIADLLECAEAPRDGRALLARTLTERFPQNAPVRQSILRARSAAAITPQAHATPTPLAHDRSTIAGHASAMAPGGPPAAALPSLGEARGMPTATIPPPARNRTWIVLLLVGFAVTGLVTFGVVSAVTGGKKTGTGSGSGTGTAATVPVTTASDAGMPDAPPAPPPPPPPIDASVADAAVSDAKKDASSIPAAHPVTEKRVGRLAVKAFPVLVVYVDKKSYGESPVTISLPIGKHFVRLVNSDVHHDESVTITINENQTTTIDRE